VICLENKLLHQQYKEQAKINYYFTNIETQVEEIRTRNSIMFWKLIKKYHVKTLQNQFTSSLIRTSS